MVMVVLFVLRSVKVTRFVLEGNQASLLEHECAVMRHILIVITLCMHVDCH